MPLASPVGKSWWNPRSRSSKLGLNEWCLKIVEDRQLGLCLGCCLTSCDVRGCGLKVDEAGNQIGTSWTGIHHSALELLMISQ